jgi:hypothetical protein
VWGVLYIFSKARLAVIFVIDHQIVFVGAHLSLGLIRVLHGD